MKFSDHFEFYTSKVRPYITKEICISIVQSPIKSEKQNNGRMRYWGWSEKYSKYIRVIVLEDNETILTAHFDRNFKL
jgi:hypothetical protein